jgi:hypothetical protein
MQVISKSKYENLSIFLEKTCQINYDNSLSSRGNGGMGILSIFT